MTPFICWQAQLCHGQKGRASGWKRPNKVERENIVAYLLAAKAAPRKK